MPVIAIIGAGPGMGLAIARTCGAQGFKGALLSRNPGKHYAIIGTPPRKASKQKRSKPMCWTRRRLAQDWKLRSRASVPLTYLNTLRQITVAAFRAPKYRCSF